MATNRYANGKIYKLVNDNDDEIYVGSTCVSLAARLYRHKDKAKREPRKVYHHLTKIGMEHVKIILIEEYPCDNKMQLLRRERYWIEELHPSLNIEIPTRTPSEWYQDNKEKKSLQAKQNREKNKTHLKERAQKYYQDRKDFLHEKVKCDCGRELSRQHLTRHKKENKKHQTWLASQPSTSST
jgi:group I intron endonuclease